MKYDDLKFRELTLADMEALDLWAEEVSDKMTPQERFDDIGQLACTFKMIHLACETDIPLQDMKALIPLGKLNDLVNRLGIPFADTPGETS